MIILDKALEKRRRDGRPIRIAIIGAGFGGAGVALQIFNAVPGMRVVVIGDRTLAQAEQAYRDAGAPGTRRVESVPQLEDAIRKNDYAVTNDPIVICEAEGIDAVLDATHDMELGAQIALHALENGKHVILANPALDATLGPILQVYADRAGVILSSTDGERPGAILNLHRFVKAIGCQPVMAGVVNPHAEALPERNAKSFTFANLSDDTRLAFEMTIVANATGFQADPHNVLGEACACIRDLAQPFGVDEILDGGLAGAMAASKPGIFVIGHNDHSLQRHYLKACNQGDGPFYLFHAPAQLGHFETPLSLARAVLFRDAVLAPAGAPVCDVITVTKRAMRAGDVLDGVGGSVCQGVMESAQTCQADRLLPMALSGDCTLMRDVAAGERLRYDDVELPLGRLADTLRQEQNDYFSSTPIPAALASSA